VEVLKTVIVDVRRKMKRIILIAIIVAGVWIWDPVFKLQNNRMKTCRIYVPCKGPSLTWYVWWSSLQALTDVTWWKCYIQL
jgi:hypothetical protein